MSAHHRFSLNQATIKQADLPTTLRVARSAGVEAVGLWRDRVHEVGLPEAARLLAESGLRFSSLCRGGFVTDPAQDRDAWEANLRAIEETAALAAAGAAGSAPVLVLVVGGLAAGSTDLAAARGRVRTALTRLAEEAEGAGVRLALEPMHPVFCADRGVVSTLEQGLDLLEDLDPAVAGVVIDTYHVWWDPGVHDAIARAGAEQRIASYQVGDWITPVPEGALLGRGIPGEGHIDFADLTGAVTRAGWTGDVETEVFNADLWELPFDVAVERAVRAFETLVVPSL